MACRRFLDRRGDLALLFCGISGVMEGVIMFRWLGGKGYCLELPLWV